MKRKCLSLMTDVQHAWKVCTLRTEQQQLVMKSSYHSLHPGVNLMSDLHWMSFPTGSGVPHIARYVPLPAGGQRYIMSSHQNFWIIKLHLPKKCLIHGSPLWVVHCENQKVMWGGISGSRWWSLITLILHHFYYTVWLEISSNTFKDILLWEILL